MGKMVDTLKYILDRFKLHDKYTRFFPDVAVEIPAFNRVMMAGLFNELGFKTGAEIGVLGGDYSLELCKAIPDLKLYAVDPWDTYDTYRDWRTRGALRKWREKAYEKLSPYNVTFIEKWSMEAVKDVEDNSLDFVYIDGNHEFPFVVNDICEWSKKVREGGIISGHDFYESKTVDTRMHVTYAVKGYTASYRIRPWFLLGRKHAPEGEIRDRERSWMFVNRKNYRTRVGHEDMPTT